MNDERGEEIVEMDALLRRAAADFPYPKTPALSVDVVQQLEDARGWPNVIGLIRGWWQQPALRGAAAALGAVALLLVTVLSIPQSRTAVADFLGLQHVQVRPLDDDVDLPPPLSLEEFAIAVSLDVAEAKSSVPLRFAAYPGSIGAPDAIYLQQLGNDVVVIFSYEEAGFDLYQSELRGYFSKVVPNRTKGAEANGVLAFWVPAGGHMTEYIDENGVTMAGSQRTVERAVLLWQEGGVTYRLETSLTLEETLRVAESLQ